ncbi:hypothetical protein D3C81_1745860 [compost metagenome]
MCVLVRAQEPSPSSLAEQRATNVTQVVLGILSYARWPVEPARLRLCILGPTEYTDDLIKGTTQATGRAVVVSRRLAADPHTADECDAVYIGALDSAQRSQLFSVLMGRPVLSISEADADCAVGSLFCLQVSDAHVGFAVNLDSVARSGVRIHPSVLQLSKRRAVQS